MDNAESEDSSHFPVEMSANFSLEKNMVFVDYSGFIEFLDNAKAVTRSKWIDHMMTVLRDLPDESRKAIFIIVRNEDGFRNLLLKESYRELETLNLKGYPELWRQFVGYISEKEIATIEYAKEKLDGLSEDAIKDFALSRGEIELYLNLSLAVQKIIDPAYIHQLALEDFQDGKKLGPNAKILGYEYLYNENTPYIDIFTEEFTNLVDTLEFYSANILTRIEDGVLPDGYRLLARYLHNLASNFGSKETDHEILLASWRNINTEYISLVQSGCPIILTPWGFSIDSNHIGIELMVTINLDKSSYWYETSQEYLNIVSGYTKNYDPDFKTIPFIHQYVFARNGINMPWSGTACAGESYIVFYDNENDDLGYSIYRSYYHEFLTGTTSEERFSIVRGVNTIAHETGHLGRMLDEDLYKKMGLGAAIGKLDEAKADTMANLFFLLKDPHSPSFEITGEEFIEQYIIDYVDELRSSIGHEDEDIGITWYGFSAKLILYRLFECGAIIWEGERVRIVDGDLGVRSLADVGQEIFELYGDPNFTQSSVKAYVATIEQLAEDNPDVRKFIAKCVAAVS